METLRKVYYEERTTGDYSRFLKGLAKDEYDSSTTNLVTTTLCDFLVWHKEEIGEYHGISDQWPVYEQSVCDYEIILLEDISSKKNNTMKPSVKKSYRKAGKARRDKMKANYHYENPFNRIHGFVIIQGEPGSKKDSIALNIVCSSAFTDQKGVGSYLMTCVEELGKASGYKDIVLEVGNHYATTYKDDMKPSTDVEQMGEEVDEEESCESIIDLCAKQLWKKTVRKNEEGPVYLIEEDYIRSIVSEYLYDDEVSHEDYEVNEDDNDDLYGYGGHFFEKGKRSSQALISFYESRGYREEPKIHTVWKCFTDTPLPTMMKEL
jgi:hypothetical protein